MNNFAYVFLVVSWIALFLGGFIYSKNSKDPLNRIFMVFSLGISLCAFSAFGICQAETVEIAAFWLNLNNNIFWPLTLAFLLHLVLVFVEKRELLKKKIIFVLIYAPALLFLVLTQTTSLSIVGEPTKVWYGWTAVIPENPLIAYISLLWSVVIVLLSLYFCGRFFLQITDYTKQQQTKYVLIGLSLSVATGLITGILFPLLRIQLPGLTMLAFALSCVFIGYANLRYQLFALTPAIAAENILATMSDFLFIVNKEGIIQQVNQVTLNTLGWEESELINQPMSKLFTDKGFANWIFNETRQEALKSSNHPIVHDIETTVTTKTGRTIPISLSNSLIHNTAGHLRGIVYSARDITARRQAEKALRESEAKLKAQYKGIPVPTFTWQRVGDDFVLVDYNDAADLFTEGNVAKFIGKTAREMFPDTLKIQEELLRCYTEKTVIKREMRYQFRLTGQNKDLAVSYAFVPPDLVMVHTEDITERKRAEEALKAAKVELELQVEQRTSELQVSEAQLRAQYKGIPVPTYTWQRVKDDFILVDYNDAAEVITQKNVAKFIGKTAREMYHDRPEIREDLLLCFSKQTVIRKELQYQFYAGYSKELSVSYVFVPPDLIMVHTEDITERKRAEVALKESEKKYRTTFETLQDVYYCTDMEGNITNISPSVRSQAGYDPQEIIGQPASVFYLNPSDRNVLVQKLNELGMVNDFEIKLKHKDGSLIDVSVTTHLVFGKNGHPEAIEGILRNITARKRAEEALRASEERFRQFFENAPEYCYIISPEGGILDVNKAVLKVLGYTKDELVGKPLKTLYAPESLPKMKRLFEKWKQMGEISNEEMVIITKYGVRRTVLLSASVMRDTDGRIQQSVSVQKDITERKQAEAALRESEAKYSALVEQADDGVAIIQDGVLKFTNPMLAEMSGYSILELMEMPFLDMVSPKSRDMLAQQYQSRMAGEKISPLHEFKLKCKDGTIKDIEVTYGEINYQERPANIAIIRNITMRKRMEKARQDLEEKRANFIAITSHELRTPLTAIKGYTELLENRLDKFGHERRDQCYKIIKRNIRRLERLIEGVSTLGQIERGAFHLDFKEVDFCDLLTEAMQPYQTSLGPQLEVWSCPERQPVLVKGDPDRLLQVIGNILENAIKNTPQDQRKILVTFEVLPQIVRMQVTDNGAGIAPENLIRIFEPFTAIPTQYSVGGTGIGLFISRMIIEAHGGSLSAQSEGTAQGATFILELPRYER